MNKKKIEEYQNLKSGIHTIQLIAIAQYHVDDYMKMNAYKFLNECKDLGIITKGNLKALKNKSTRISLVINLNKLQANYYSEGLIRDWDLVKKKFDYLIKKLSIDNYAIKRVDIALDSTNNSYYDEYIKVNTMLIKIIGQSYKVRNGYKVSYLYDTDKVISIAIKNKYFELEYYNKSHESENKDYSKARLEFRCKALNVTDLDDIPETIVSAWKTRVNKVWSLSRLEEEWLKTLKNQYDNRSSEINANIFINEKKEDIYTRKMLYEIVDYVKNSNKYSGVGNISRKAEYLKKKYKIELYHINDIKTIYDYWLNEIKNFFYIDIEEIDKKNDQ